LTHHPRLLDECFVPNQLLHSEQEGAIFYYQHEWQRLLYNQIHHYHACFKGGKLDIRHLAEQSSLLVRINQAVDLESKITDVFGGQAIQAYFQFALLQRLFGQPSPFANMPLSRIQQQKLDDTIALLLGNPVAKVRHERSVIWAMFTYIFRQLGNRHWLKQRVFNLDWYRARPAVLRYVITKKITLR